VTSETGRPPTATVRRSRSRSPTSRPGGTAEGPVDRLQVAVEQLAELARDRALEPEGVKVVGQRPVGVADHGGVLEAAVLLRPGTAELDGGLGGRLQGHRPLGQGEDGVAPGRVGPGPLGEQRDGPPCRLGHC
jgi:hypothetical protein